MDELTSMSPVGVLKPGSPSGRSMPFSYLRYSNGCWKAPYSRSSLKPQSYWVWIWASKNSSTESHGHASGFSLLPTIMSISRSDFASPGFTAAFMAPRKCVLRPNWGSTKPSCSGKKLTGSTKSHRPMMVGVMKQSCAALKSIFMMPLYQRSGSA